jgi:hypothetical protein
MQKSAVQCVEDVVQSSEIQCNKVQCNAVQKIAALHDGCDGSAREYAFQFSCSLCWPLFYKITKNWNVMQECFISDHKSGPLICSLQGPPRCEQNWMSIIIVRACFISLPPSPPSPPHSGCIERPVRKVSYYYLLAETVGLTPLLVCRLA